MKKHIEKIIALCIFLLLLVCNIILSVNNKKADEEFLDLVSRQEAVTAELETSKENFKANEEERNFLKLELEDIQKKISDFEGDKSFIKDEEYLMIYGEWKIVEKSFGIPYRRCIPEEEFLDKTFYIDHNKYIFDGKLMCEGSPLIYPLIMISKSYWSRFLSDAVRSGVGEKEREIFGNSGEYHIGFLVPAKASSNYSIEVMYVVDDDTLVVANLTSGFYTAKRVRHVDNWREKIKT